MSADVWATADRALVRQGIGLPFRILPPTGTPLSRSFDRLSGINIAGTRSCRSCQLAGKPARVVALSDTNAIARNAPSYTNLSRNTIPRSRPNWRPRARNCRRMFSASSGEAYLECGHLEQDVLRVGCGSGGCAELLHCGVSLFPKPKRSAPSGS